MDRFEFDIDGTTHSLMAPQFPFGVWRRLTDHDYMSQIGILLEYAAQQDPQSKAALAALDKLEPVEVAKKLKGWLGAQPGESSEPSKS